TGVVIRDAILPAAKCNADPLESQGPYGSMMVFASLPLLLIVDTRPVAQSDGMAGPFVESLAKKFRTSPSEVNPLRLAAPLHDGCDATELLHAVRVDIALAPRSEGDHQARRQGRTSAGKRIED